MCIPLSRQGSVLNHAGIMINGDHYYMRLPVFHGLLHSDTLSNLLVSTFTEAKATAPHYYNDNLLLESLNSKLQSFYYKPCGYRCFND